MKIVRIEWADSYTTDKWIEKDSVVEEMGSEYIMTTVGYLFEKTKDSIIICHSYNDTMVSGLLHIPRKCVKKIKIIKKI